MKIIFLQQLFLICLLASIFTNSINLSGWIMDVDRMELCEMENADGEKEDLKNKKEKDEIFAEKTYRNYAGKFQIVVSPVFEINFHIAQYSEILTPPPELL